MTGHQRQYPEHFVDRLEILRGEGFLSPGGAHEVRDLEGALGSRRLEAVDEDLDLHRLEVRRALRDAMNAGALRPTHVRGYKPRRG